MEFIRFENAKQFATVAEPIVEKQEDVFSLFYGVLQAIKAGKYENPFMAAVVEGDEVLALLQMTPPHPVNLVIVDESKIDEVIDFIIREINETAVTVTSVISLKQWAELFADKWVAHTGEKQKLLMDQGLYRLENVDKTIDMSPGSWRYATMDDHSLIVSWYSFFEDDANLERTPIELVKDRVTQFIEAQEVFLWEDEGKVVSMMKKSRPTRNGVTVSLVFTPKEERRKGYARTMVAYGSMELLKEYDFCVLYTDMMNPTSNKIYKEIGYKHIADSIHIGFEK
ncbi:GNAT family N-acetyltransferase [Sporosarcina thermotolerans]|uniref:GNAT family N-acetyltransferase n=1 Tax=Sporosarcina thermotolerans TaxID=633404 RepID=A0AAW9A6W6_9BACL|nr:GNAT family N-acetyltransferase [Sporosarcina thermotolerans]MDW0117092.1 GNAT family N-acetyltransferase [Sporosarcina thermotolerans]WHT47814.1 GNAT family N-acetyltransferase [Sporosarcina thermotolerans]